MTARTTTYLSALGPLLFALAACAPADPTVDGQVNAALLAIPPGALVPGRPGIVVPSPGRPVLPPTCSRTALWISASPALGCPAVPALSTGLWSARPLHGASAPPALASLCAYDWTPSVANPTAGADVAFLASSLAATQQPSPELDCPVVSAMSDDAALDDALWSAMNETLRSQVDATRVGAPFATKTKVAILDSAALPFSERTRTDTYGHGRLVGRLIEDLTCFDSPRSCASDLGNYLALPYLREGERSANGGFMGRREDLARAIHAAVDDHVKRLTADAQAPRRLVLNLSIGWDPVHGGDVPLAALGPASYVVYAALARASCIGAVTIAAAGNAHGTSSVGPVLPGAWERLKVPSVAQCKRLLNATDTAAVALGWATSIGDDAPLVYAAAGLDERDGLLATTRTGAAPRLAAYALDMVTTDVGGARGSRTLVLTGSSFAAAVVSAAVVNAWAVAPSLPPAKVVQLVYDAGVDVSSFASPSGTAELCREGRCEPIHRASVCAALRASACGTGLCALAPTCDPVPAGEGLSAWTRDLFARAGDTALVTTVASARDGVLPSVAGEPWAHGQPEREGCVRCSVRALSGDVTIELSNEARLATTAVYVQTSRGRYYLAPPSGSRYPRSFTARVPAFSPDTRAFISRSTVGSASISEDIAVLDERGGVLAR